MDAGALAWDLGTDQAGNGSVFLDGDQSRVLSRVMLFGEGRPLARLVLLRVDQGGLAKLDLARHAVS